MIFAVLGMLLIGLSLGLLGLGGSILTVPILVLLLGRPEKLAIAESLAIVGCVAIIGSILYAIQAKIHWKSLFQFGFPGILGAYLGASLSLFIPGFVQLILFSFVMIVVALSILSSSPLCANWNVKGITIIQGFIVGGVSGLIGVGGGFLIVPALITLCNLSLPVAVGTSLTIIAMNSLTGFCVQCIALKNLHLQVDWRLIGMISFVGALGCGAGKFLTTQISPPYLRRISGYAILILALIILFKFIPKHI